MKKTILFLLLASLLPFSICGCRESPVLEQVVYQQQQETDNENDSIDTEEDTDNQDEELPPQEQIDDSETKKDQKREDAISGNNNNSADKTYDPNYQDNAGENGKSSTSPSDTTNTEGNSEATNGQGEDTQNSQTGKDSSEGGNGSLENGDTSGSDDQPSDGDVYRQVVDARGETVDIPENVDSVTAVGEAATMVEMLGGSGRLLASSASFSANNLVKQAFSDVSSVKQWWDYDGSGTISSSNFNALLDASPDVCFEISGQNTFSEEQIGILNEHEIAYVVLPKLSSLEDIKKAVNIVGTVLGDRSGSGGTNAPAIADEYGQWVDRVVKKIKDKGDSKSTLYISGWDDSAYWEIKNEKDGVWRSGYGAAISGRYINKTPLNECMTLAKLKNEGSDNVYANPLKNNYWLQYISGGSGTFIYGTNLTSNLSGDALGSANFPAVVVRDAAIKSKMESDIHWGVYEWTTDAYGNYGFGMPDGNGNIIPTTIVGDYEIYVNPDGLGSWTMGSVEAPLEAAWLSCKFQGGCSMDELRSMVSEFYSTFYHMSINAADILGE